jgi:hypothetical protein
MRTFTERIPHSSAVEFLLNMLLDSIKVSGDELMGKHKSFDVLIVWNLRDEIVVFIRSLLQLGVWVSFQIPITTG